MTGRSLSGGGVGSNAGAPIVRTTLGRLEELRVPQVVVVGAGIVGAAIAYEAALVGAAVTLVDTSLPGSGAHASQHTPGGRVAVPARPPLYQ